MKNASAWITEIDFQLENLKLNNRHSFYGFSLEMNKQIANEIETHFRKEGYQVEARECPRKLFDLIITW